MVHVATGTDLPQPNLLTPKYLERYSDLGLHCYPLCCPNSQGLCGCGWEHQEKAAGKAPRTINGVLDATDDISSLKTMWRSFPAGNIGIGLEPSHLLFIGPDSPEWLEKFQQRGFQETT